MLKINVSTAEAVVTETELITAGRKGLRCAFAFSDDWAGLAKTVVVQGAATRDIALLATNEITVPAECVNKAQFPLKIGVYGARPDGTIAIPTIWASFGKVLPGARPSDIPPDELTPDVVAQIQEAANNALYLARNVQSMADSGAFDGEDGVSPTVTSESITGGHRLTITDADGTTTVDVMNGQDGQDGQDAVVDATLSNPGEAADAAETGKVKELADAVADRNYDFSTAIDDADITILRGKNINSSNNLVDNENYSVLYLTAPAAGRYRVVSTSNSQLALRVYSSTSMSSSTYVKAGIPGYTGYTRYVDLEAGQVLAVRAKSTTFTVEVSYATSYTVGLRQNLPLTEKMEEQIRTTLVFPDDLEFPISAAHRGLASAGKVENTMPAYEDAVAKGWRYLETDIRKTSDDVWVLLHDATIAAGVNIADITYAQALTYDLGGGTHIATLEELLILCRRAHVYPIIEVKDSSISQTDADAVWALLEKYEMEHCVFWLCSSVGGVSKFLAKDPYAPAINTSSTAWTYVDPTTFEDYSPYVLKYKTGKNKVFYARLASGFSTKADMDNFVDFCEYFGLYAGVYGPTTQAGIDGLSDRLSMVTSEVYKYEIERETGGGGGGGAVTSVNGQTGDVVLTIPSKVSDLTNDSGFVDAAGAAAAAPVSSVNGQTGAVTLSIPSTAADVGAVAVSQGVAHAGEFVVVGSDGNVTTMTLSTWQGGNY